MGLGLCVVRIAAEAVLPRRPRPEGLQEKLRATSVVASGIVVDGLERVGQPQRVPCGRPGHVSVNHG